MCDALLVTGRDDIDGRDQRGIVSARFGKRLLARLPQHECAPRRVPIDQQALHPSGAALALPSSLRDLARPLDRHASKYGRVHELIDQPEVERFLGADLLAGENQVQRIGEPDSPRQPLCSARTGDQSQLNFRETEDGSWMIGRNAIVAGERSLESSAQTCAMYRRDYRHPKVFDGIEQHLTIPAQPLSVCRSLELQKLFDIGARNPNVWFATDEHRGVDGRVALESAHQRDELVLHCAVQLVDRLVREIERDDGDAVGDLDREGRFPARPDESADRDFRSRAHRVLSTTIAKPIPPAAHTVISPNCPSRRRNSCRSVVVIRAPVAPNGCPMAIEPPMTLSFALSTSPTGCENPARSTRESSCSRPRCWRPRGDAS